MPRLPRPERRTPRDLLAVAGIAIAAAVLVGGAVVTADTRDVKHSVATSALTVPKTVAPAGAKPRGVEEKWSTTNKAEKLSIGQGGVLIQQDARTVAMKDITTGEQAWSYTAPRDICGTAINRTNTLVVLHTDKGCGEVVEFDTSTGTYGNTRAALASDRVAIQQSNDNVGTVSNSRVELWRDDLVRTVEIGRVEAPAQPGKQKHSECAMGSALWRTNLLATVQNCHEDQQAFLRLMKATPEESSIPEDFNEWEIPLGSVLVGIGQQRAVVYVPATKAAAPEFQIFSKDGALEAKMPAKSSPLAESATDGFSAITADLPHHITWWDGDRLVAFDPSSMKPQWGVDNARGVGDNMGGFALVPTAEGIAVINWNNGRVEKVLPVYRGSRSEPIQLRTVGDYIVEHQGKTTTVFRANFR